ncbi:MAG TPA: hypothetical protein VKY85_07545 [Candidatus Angelobacter sp.]|nr:hypothetical protein [Candidatus Angelobacter sp.]
MPNWFRTLPIQMELVLALCLLGFSIALFWVLFAIAVHDARLNEPETAEGQPQEDMLEN